MTTVRLHYWAGARAAAGVASETWSAATINEALTAARSSRADSGFGRVLGVCSFLVEGVVLHPDDLSRPLTASVEVEVLPPFAGGR